jgi:tetratricopeptide (TPR) repeat protein
VTAPAFFRLKTEGQESFFQGPGMVFLLVKLDDPQAVKISNPWFLELLQNTEGTGSVKTETLAGRSWALRDAVSGEVSIRQGFAYLGTMPVKVEVGVPRAEGKLGDQLRLLLIQNLRRKDYDRLNQGKALAKLGLHARALEELAGVEPTLEVQIQQVASLVALARYDEADKLLKQLETEHPQDLAVQTQRWWLADRSKDYQRALAACRKVSELEKDAHKKIHHKVGEAALLAKLGRHQEAASLYAQARASDDARIDSAIWNSQAWVLVLSGRFREALPLAEKAIQKGKSAANLDTRGRALLELGRWQEAKADFEEILNENVNEPYANYAVGRIMQQEGDKEQARLFYFRYLALAGENAEFADDARQRANEMAGIKAPPER